MAWVVVGPDRSKRNRSIPGASVGYGRITLNVAACNLIENYEKYKYIELLTDSEQPSVVGVRFLEKSTEKSISIKRKVSTEGKIVGGIEIAAKYHVQELFGIKGTQKKTTNYPVTKDAEDILVIRVE